MSVSIFDNMEEKKLALKKKLASIKFDNGTETNMCWRIATELRISGTTVKNYISGKNIPDGYMGEAIYETYLKLKNTN